MGQPQAPSLNHLIEINDRDSTRVGMHPGGAKGSMPGSPTRQATTWKNSSVAQICYEFIGEF